MPARIQRKRTKGWTMPRGAVYVGRPTTWGNPFRMPGTSSGQYGMVDFPIATRAESVAAFTNYAERHVIDHPDWLEPLRGMTLACWCPLDQPCHADVLIELANREITVERDREIVRLRQRVDQLQTDQDWRLRQDAAS